ncbi:winged helix-turn-helix domain-containing protein [Kitasatospora sp. NBC_01266]|uniref:winged helix-turn-helix domain-containing protein n=1 Tax=Kitasatospora sp. NBC_01266 TaxID=2903572 RepID=UPI002E2FC092|nr:winged helix-turn-helix domain-containing protein [Kitasatospora sp. NBC_01266]
MSSSSSATLTAPAATPHLRAVRSVSAAPSAAERRHPAPGAAIPLPPTLLPIGHAQLAGYEQSAMPSALLGALPEGAAVVATLPQSSLPQSLLAQYGAQLGLPGGAVQPLVGYLVLVPAEPAATGLAPAAVPAAVPAAAPVAFAAPVLPAAGTGGRGARSAARGISVDPERRSAHVDGELLDLTYLEFELLAHLTQHPQRVHTRDQLVSAVWGYGHVGDGRTVDVHVARLRRKLGAAHRDSIVTVRRVGYKYTPITQS